MDEAAENVTRHDSQQPQNHENAKNRPQHLFHSSSRQARRSSSGVPSRGGTLLVGTCVPGLARLWSKAQRYALVKGSPPCGEYFANALSSGRAADGAETLP